MSNNPFALDRDAPQDGMPSESNPYAAPHVYSTRQVVARPTSQALTFGIISVVRGAVGLLFCSWVFSAAALAFGIPAIIMGSRDLKASTVGMLDNRSRGNARAGQVLGIVGVALAVLAIALGVIFIFVTIPTWVDLQM